MTSVHNVPLCRRRLSDSDFPPSDLHLTSAAAGYPQGREWQKTKPPRDLEASFSKLDETRKYVMRENFIRMHVYIGGAWPCTENFKH